MTGLGYLHRRFIRLCLALAHKLPGLDIRQMAIELAQHIEVHLQVCGKHLKCLATKEKSKEEPSGNG